MSVVSCSCFSFEGQGCFGVGENLVKCDQILDGVKKVFVVNGYDGVSMNDIMKVVGVFKGMIYVYFNNKEEFFVGLIQCECECIFDVVSSILVDDKLLEEVFFDFGMMFGWYMMNLNMVCSLCMVLGVIDDMLEVVNMFLNCGLM